MTTYNYAVIGLINCASFYNMSLEDACRTLSDLVGSGVVGDATSVAFQIRHDQDQLDDITNPVKEQRHVAFACWCDNKVKAMYQANDKERAAIAKLELSFAA